MSRSLRTIPAGALAAFAVVLLASPQAGAVGDRAGRPAAGAPRPAASAPPGPAGRPAHGHPGGTPAGSPHGGAGPRGGRPADGSGEDAAGAAVHEGWDPVRRADGVRHGRHGRRHVRDEQAEALVHPPHGVPGASRRAPSAAPADDRGDVAPAHGDDSPEQAPRTADGQAWPAPVAPPADPLLTSGVWRPADAAQDQAPAQAGSAVDRTATAMSGAPVLPVLTFGAGLTSLGLGIAFFALRLRRG